MSSVQTRRPEGLFFLLMVCCCCLATGCIRAHPPEVEDLENQLFKLSSGAAFSDKLAEKSATLLFSSFEDSSRGHFVLSSANPDSSGNPRRISGHFDLPTCTFYIKESNFESETFPELQSGPLKMNSCEFAKSVKSLSLAGSREGALSTSEPAKRLYNIVVILTDDQRWDTLWAMPLTKRLAQRGVEFSNAYTTMPLCCPFRASLLAGGILTHNTNVLTNSWPNGGTERFDDSLTLATILADAGYRTGHFGKYMNGLANIAPRIPAGWTEFAGNLPSSRTPELSWFDFYTLEGSRWPGKADLRSSSEGSESGAYVHVTTYSPYYYQKRALSFLEQVGKEPFFLYVAPRAPHVPATPAPEDANSFADYDYQERAYGEVDLSDKPEWVRFDATRFDVWKDSRGDLPRKSLQSLQAVDRLVGSIHDGLVRLGILENTIILFTSDSGFQWLEHRLTNKGAPYEETLKVPLIVSIPGMTPRKDDHLVAVNLDIGATILDLVGSQARTDGFSLLPHLNQSNNHGERRQIFFEEFPLSYTPVAKNTDPRSFPPRYFAGLRASESGGEWKYIEHYSGERELYDLVADPYEKESLHDELKYKDLMRDFSVRVRDLKGLGITTFRLAPGALGEPYLAELTAQGGTKPYSWRVLTGKLPGIRTRRHVGPKLDGLPKGLSLENATGRLRGIPTTAGLFEFVVEVRDSSRSHRSNQVQTFFEHLSILIKDR